MQELLSRAKRIHREEGLPVLLDRTIKKSKQELYRKVAYSYKDYVHPHLPETDTYKECNGVKVSTKKKYFDDVVPFVTPTSDRPNFKAGNITAIRNYVQVGDTVVVVGGGSGITPAIQSSTIGEEGELKIYEGSKQSIEELEETFSLNPTPSSYSTHHTVVGPKDTVTGEGIDDAELLPVTDLPACDVLELDCEGAETEIIPNLTIRPRVIIVETHPYVGVDTDAIRSEISNLGYEIVDEFDDASAGWILPDGNVLVGLKRD